MNLVANLRRDGVAVLPLDFMGGISKNQLISFRNYLQACSWNVGTHISGKATLPKVSLSAAVAKSNVFCVHMHDVIMAPHFFECALGMHRFACEYFGGFARLYSLNAFITKAREGGQHEVYGDTQAWHQDHDDLHQFTIFMYGSNVYGHGIYEYMMGSHDGGVYAREAGRVPQSPVGPSVARISGAAGTIFVSDTSGQHRSTLPMPTSDVPWPSPGVGWHSPGSSEDPLRLLVWARYGVSNPPDSYKWDKLSPLNKGALGDRYPEDPELQEAIRLVVA